MSHSTVTDINIRNSKLHNYMTDIFTFFLQHLLFVTRVLPLASALWTNAWQATGGKAVSPLCRALIMLIQTEGSIFPSSVRRHLITSSCWQLHSASECLLSPDSSLKSWHFQLTLAPDPRHRQLQIQSPELQWHHFQPCRRALYRAYSLGYCSMSLRWAATTKKKKTLRNHCTIYTNIASINDIINHFYGSIFKKLKIMFTMFGWLHFTIFWLKSWLILKCKEFTSVNLHILKYVYTCLEMLIHFFQQ